MKRILPLCVALVISLPAFAQVQPAIPRSAPFTLRAPGSALHAIQPHNLNLHPDWSRRPADAHDVSVAADLDDQGNVLSALIRKSSGDAGWDAACVSAVRHAGPLPAPQGDFGRSVPHKVIFTLRGPMDSVHVTNDPVMLN